MWPWEHPAWKYCLNCECPRDAWRLSNPLAAGSSHCLQGPLLCAGLPFDSTGCRKLTHRTSLSVCVLGCLLQPLWHGVDALCLLAFNIQFSTPSFGFHSSSSSITSGAWLISSLPWGSHCTSCYDHKEMLRGPQPETAGLKKTCMWNDKQWY